SVYRYDGNGNRIYERDGAGNVVERSYGAQNQLLAETRYAQPDPDGDGAALPSAPETTRYLYDEKNHLRFVIGAERRVAEMRYDSKGQRISSISHAAPLDPALVGSASADALATWANGLATKSKGIRTDYSYDVRGLLSSSTSYATLDDSGNGISDGSQSTVTYIYDQAGRLVKSIDAKKGSTSYAYDGAGRIIATRQPNEFSVRTEYNDVPVSRVIGGVTLLTTQSTSTQYNGLVTVSTFDSEGKLVSVLERDANGNVIGETLYGYDDSGRPLWTEGPTGARSYTFYDGFNRKAADIDADGTYTEYVYNNEGQLAQLIRHAQPVNVAALAGSDPISTLSIQKLPRGAKPGDEVEYRGYDAAGR
ncbi:RHS repeat protein, partial [Massilia sp. BJB1822]|uniref:RHS repeat protein n=1 Tax=Massilia sp. BJB1822 TaxID=2744470 RepID=UPI001594C157